MNIVVCIKQVPETGQEIKIDPKTNTLIREGVRSIINPFDMYAIEEGIKLKERYKGKVTVITMGPPQAEEVLREAISLGCDETILITDRTFAGSDTFATSYTLSKAIQKLKDYDLIICGKQASDGDTAQVGPGISAHLDIPQVTYVKKIEEIILEKPVTRPTESGYPEKPEKNYGYAKVQRMTEEGYEVIQSPLPALLTVVKEINEPRLPSLKGLMRAKNAQIIKWTHKDLNIDPDETGLKGSPTQVIKIFTPPPRRGGEIFQGEVRDTVEKLVEALKKELV